MLRVVQAVAAVVLVGATVWLATLMWTGAMTRSGYRGDLGSFQVNRCLDDETPDGTTHSCTGVFFPEGVVTSTAAVRLDPADEAFADNTRLTVRRVGDQVFVPKTWFVILLLGLVIVVGAALLGFAASLGYAAVTDDDWTFGLGCRWLLVANLCATGLVLVGALVMAVVLAIIP
ncbi:hypothetical protein [Actinokineospora inagensis]|uniref:hypothetical protein n=1 Tax=Actinokineospora inagensis TaxID=103730 RepID=UPI00042035BA|nr:hypothetical protein [Actinokineospora inagensis]